PRPRRTVGLPAYRRGRQPATLRLADECQPRGRHYPIFSTAASTYCRPPGLQARAQPATLRLAEKCQPERRHYPIFSTAALNLFISSCVPIVTRTLVGHAFHTRPMMTFCSAMAFAYSVPGRPTSIMKKFVSLGTYLMFFFSRKENTSSR